MGKEYKYKQFLYKMVFPNGMVYIGCTHSIKERWAWHGCHYKGCKTVYAAIQEFGWENIEKKVICELPPSFHNEDSIKALEKEFIKAYGNRCYNDQANPMYYIDNPNYAKVDTNTLIQWTAFGETKPMKEWVEQYHTSSAVVKARMERHGMSIEEALTLPTPPKEYRGKQAYKYWQKIRVGKYKNNLAEMPDVPEG